MLPATITSIRQAIQEIKSFGCEDWEGEGRVAARQALQQVLEHRMHNLVDEHLMQMAVQGVPDRRNGYYGRHLLCELGDLEVQVPRTRTFGPMALLKRFAGRLVCAAAGLMDPIAECPLAHGSILLNSKGFTETGSNIQMRD